MYDYCIHINAILRAIINIGIIWFRTELNLPQSSIRFCPSYTRYVFVLLLQYQSVEKVLKNAFVNKCSFKVLKKCWKVRSLTSVRSKILFFKLSVNNTFGDKHPLCSSLLPLPSPLTPWFHPPDLNGNSTRSFMQIFPGDACCYDSLNTQGAETGVEHFTYRECSRLSRLRGSVWEKKSDTRRNNRLSNNSPLSSPPSFASLKINKLCGITR